MAIWNILQTFGTFYGRLVHFVFIWYIFPVLVSCIKKNLATLVYIITLRQQGFRVISGSFGAGFFLSSEAGS
jgi:hypothetical protein